MKSFKELGLSENLLHTLSSMQFTTPTPIQAEAIPVALEGKDILGSAQTGTGKTGAFGIPLINKLLLNKNAHALVLTPTRELAKQVLQQLQAMLGKKSKIKNALLIGGEDIGKQLKQLSQTPRLIVGTPGRINDHLKRKSLSIEKTEFLVLDETDRMLDMGFSIQIEEILQHINQSHQTLLFSATLPKNIIEIATKYLTDPVRIAMTSQPVAATNVKQEVLNMKEDEKYPILLDQLNERSGSIIIFLKTKSSTEKMAKKLNNAGYSTDAIHGDLRQNKRERVIKAFRNQKYRILVATDVAARGLDIPHIEHVINYDLPQCPEDYIHRIGRTARAGAKGFALNLISPSDQRKWNAINKLMNPSNDSETTPDNKKTRIKPNKYRKPIKISGKRNASERRDSEKGNYASDRRTSDRRTSDKNNRRRAVRSNKK